MNIFVILLLYCVAVLDGAPSYHHHGEPLMGVPDVSHYGKLVYPKYDLIDLGSSTKDHLPPAVVQIHVTKKVEVPKPYPVKVPVPVPHPVHIPKPYPVVETKIIKVPHPVPVEVIKKVPVPIEVPKPYPVSQHEFGGNQHGGGGDSYSAGYQVEQSAGGDEGYGGDHNHGGYEGLSGAGFGGGEHALADQSGNYGAVAEAQTGWQPSTEIMGEQQQEEQH